MIRLAIVAGCAVLILAVGAIGFVMLADAPAPVGKVEKVLPDDRFPR